MQLNVWQKMRLPALMMVIFPLDTSIKKNEIMPVSAFCSPD
jgi:hypothetical protein